MINIVILATNIYSLLGVRLIKQLNYRYKGKIPLHIHVFTDVDMKQYLPVSTKNVTVHYQTHNSWVNGTNSKFRNIVSLEKIMVSEFESDNNNYCYYIDADTVIINDMDETFFTLDASQKFTNAEHSNNKSLSGKNLPFERRKISRAYVPKTDKDQLYYYGAYLGGKTKDFVEMCKQLIVMQNVDKKINFEPVWNDESYINRFFHDIRYKKQCRTILNVNLKQYFQVSNKGGINNFRNVNNKPSIEDLAFLKENREKLINIVNGKIIIPII